MPEAGERPGSAPVRALRAVFSGIGQMLLAADRLRAEDAREHSQLEEPPPAPRPWGVSVTPSVRLIPAGGTDSDTVPAPAQPESPSKPQGKSRPAGKPRQSGRPASAPQRQAGGSSKSASPGPKPAGSGSRPTSGASKPRSSAKPGSSSSGRSGRKAPPPPSRFRSLDSTGNVRMLSAEDMAEMAEGTRRPVSGRTEPGRSITGSARPAETARTESRLPGYPMADYRSPSGSFGSGGSQSNPVAAAAESATSFAELATVLRETKFASPAAPAAQPAVVEDGVAQDDTEQKDTAMAAVAVDADSPDIDSPPADSPPTNSPDAALPGIEFSETELPAAELPSPELPAAELPSPEQPSAELPSPEQPSAELPIDGYDELSLPSLRARLRNLDAGQLQVLVDYERTHASRDDVVTMFERRIVKLNDDGA